MKRIVKFEEIQKKAKQKNRVYKPGEIGYLNENGDYDERLRWIEKIYNDMICICYHQWNCKYELYGGRGIKIAKEWFDEWENYDKCRKQFTDWCLTNYPDICVRSDIFRFDRNKDFTPENCYIKIMDYGVSLLME